MLGGPGMPLQRVLKFVAPAFGSGTRCLVNREGAAARFYAITDGFASHPRPITMVHASAIEILVVQAEAICS